MVVYRVSAAHALGLAAAPLAASSPDGWVQGQCCSPNSSHPLLPLLCPPVHSLHLLASFFFFPLFLIFCCLNMICQHVEGLFLIWHLLYLVVLELPGSVVWCLPLILKVLIHYYFKYFFSLPLSFSFWWSNYTNVKSLGIVPQLLDVLFLFPSSSSLHFSLGSFHWHVFKLAESFLGHVPQPPDEPAKALSSL